MNPTDTEMMDWMERNDWTASRLKMERFPALINVRREQHTAPTLRAAVASAMQAYPQPAPLPGSYSSADRNGPKASGPSIDPSAWQARGWSPIPAAAGAAPGGIDPEDDPWDGLTPADKG